MACIKTAGVTVVFSELPGASAATNANGFSAGLKMDFPKDALVARVLLECSHKVLVGKGKFVDEGRNSGGEVQVVIVVGGSGGDKEG